jgi:hypothetical protein
VYDITEFAIRGIRGNASTDIIVLCCAARVIQQERNESMKKGIFSTSKHQKFRLS